MFQKINFSCVVIHTPDKILSVFQREMERHWAQERGNNAFGETLEGNLEVRTEDVQSGSSANTF